MCCDSSMLNIDIIWDTGPSMYKKKKIGSGYGEQCIYDIISSSFE